MKCLKNTKTGNIIRVTDVQAHQMAGNQWKYVSKSEWKGSPKEETTEVVTETKHDMGGSYEVPSKKKKK